MPALKEALHATIAKQILEGLDATENRNPNHE